MKGGNKVKGKIILNNFGNIIPEEYKYHNKKVTSEKLLCLSSTSLKLFAHRFGAFSQPFVS